MTTLSTKKPGPPHWSEWDAALQTNLIRRLSGLTEDGPELRRLVKDVTEIGVLRSYTRGSDSAKAAFAQPEPAHPMHVRIVPTAVNDAILAAYGDTFRDFGIDTSDWKITELMQFEAFILDGVDTAALRRLRQPTPQEWTSSVSRQVRRAFISVRSDNTPWEHVVSRALNLGYRGAAKDLMEACGEPSGTMPDRDATVEEYLDRDPATVVDRRYFLLSKAIVDGYQAAFEEYGFDAKRSTTGGLDAIEIMIQQGANLPGFASDAGTTGI